MTTIQKELLALEDRPYKEFSYKLIPTIDPATMIGIRTPELKKLAKKLKDTEETAVFLQTLPHTYYEENNLHAFLINEIKDYETVIAALEAFLPYVDNWATCDGLRPKCFQKHRKELLAKLYEWLNRPDTYTIRFGIEMLMTHFLDEGFDVEQLERVIAIQSNEYYVNMMIAWYLATALAKQYDTVVPYIKRKSLSPWVQNKTIQKAVESYRITDEQKTVLKSYKIKGSAASKKA